MSEKMKREVKGCCEAYREEDQFCESDIYMDGLNAIARETMDMFEEYYAESDDDDRAYYDMMSTQMLTDIAGNDYDSALESIYAMSLLADQDLADKILAFVCVSDNCKRHFICALLIICAMDIIEKIGRIHDEGNESDRNL